MSYARRRFRVAPSALVWVLGGLVLVLTAVSVPLAGPVHQLALNNVGTEALTAGVYGLAGVIIARRQPRNPIGWIMLVFIVLLMLGTDGGYYAVLHYRLGRSGLPFAQVAVLLDPLWVPAVASFPLVILLFPDGRLPSRRWRWVLVGYLVLVACVLAAILIQSVAAVAGHHVRLDSFGDVVSGPQPAADRVAMTLVVVAIGMIVVSFLAHQVLSWRRASGERRQQLKWLACGATVTVAAFLLAALLGSDVIGQVVALGLIALPVSIGVGILKYRLYDIDRIISRTLAYALVTGLLVGVYAGGVLLATLAAAALFNPLRLRVQRAVDRRFNRSRYDADQTVAAFAARVKDAVDAASVRDDLAVVVAAALEPAHVSVWIGPHEAGRAMSPDPQVDRIFDIG
jgi:hypothetical protein